MERTSQGTLTWQEISDTKLFRENVVGAIYSGVVLGRALFVYECRYKDYTDEDHYELVPDIAIEFVDEKGALQWAWPKTPYRFQLLDAIRYQVSGADEFLKGFLFGDV